MNSVKTWSTKEEVLKDLAKVSGRRMGKLDESYLVIGNAPPPVIPEPEDDEMLQQFGDAIRGRGIQSDIAPPDLQGITNMLRMAVIEQMRPLTVSDYPRPWARAIPEQSQVDESDTESDEGYNNITDNSKCVIAISKLNPNVKEFVPKSSSSHSSSDISVSNAKTDIKEKIEEPNKTSVACEANVNVYEDLATKLKNSVAAKTDSFESKKQNNVAIASLLRLYATNNNKQAKPQDVKEPVKLVTPDYFENKIIPTKEPAVCPVSSFASKSTSTTPVPKSDPSCSNSVSSNDIRSEPLPDTRDVPTTPVKTVIDPAIKQSIEKVNQWMGEPVQKKAPAVCLGPISFKRRELNSSKSPSLSSDTERSIAKPPTKPLQPNEYRPSNYASDLAKKYMERTKAEESKKVNSWADLDIILKEKDEILRQKKMTQTNGNVSDAAQG